MKCANKYFSLKMECGLLKEELIRGKMIRDSILFIFFFWMSWDSIHYMYNELSLLNKYFLLKKRERVAYMRYQGHLDWARRG